MRVVSSETLGFVPCGPRALSELSGLPGTSSQIQAARLKLRNRHEPRSQWRGDEKGEFFILARSFDLLIWQVCSKREVSDEIHHSYPLFATQWAGFQAFNLQFSRKLGAALDEAPFGALYLSLWF